MSTSLSACGGEIAVYKRSHDDMRKNMQNFHELTFDRMGKINGLHGIAPAYRGRDSLSLGELRAIQGYYLGSIKQKEEYLIDSVPVTRAEAKAYICVATQMGQMIAQKVNSPSGSASLRPPASEIRGVDDSKQKDVNQSIALAQQNQAKGDEQARKDKRRRNYPELDASSCLTPDISRPGFSGFKNNCPFPVRYTYCVVSPERGTGAAFVDCSKQSGAGRVPAYGEDFAHMKGGEQVHHVACKLPGTAITRKFENGRLWADCAKLGGD